MKDLVSLIASERSGPKGKTKNLYSGKSKKQRMSEIYNERKKRKELSKLLCRFSLENYDYNVNETSETLSRIIKVLEKFVLPLTIGNFERHQSQSTAYAITNVVSQIMELREKVDTVITDVAVTEFSMGVFSEFFRRFLNRILTEITALKNEQKNLMHEAGIDRGLSHEISLKLDDFQSAITKVLRDSVTELDEYCRNESKEKFGKKTKKRRS